MSVLSKRAKHGSTISEEITRIDEQIKALQNSRAANVEALDALAQPPRVSKPAEYLLHYSQAHPANVCIGECGICDGTSIGWDASW